MKQFCKIAVLFVMLVTVFNHSIESQQAGRDTKWDNAPKVVPRTTEEMQHPDFWIKNIKGDPDKVIMNSDQIAELNRKNRSLPKTIKDINGNDYSIDNVIRSKDGIGLQYNVEDPFSIRSFPGDSLRTRLNLHKEYFDGRQKYDRRQMKFDEDEKNHLYEMTDPGSIPSVIIPKYGILVKHTLNRVLPTNMPAFSGATSWLDQLQSAALNLGMPVAILHTSKDKDWYYVRSEIAFGWIPAENVAIGSASELREYIDSKDFVVAVTHTVPVYGDQGFNAFIADLYMGSKIKLQRRTSSGYQVLMPVRKPDGSFEAFAAWIKPDAKVNVGYQQLTQRNIINTMFTLLYRPYGWADSNNEWDCCGAIRVVLRSFGIITGRWTSYELHASDHVIAMPRDTPKEKKYELLKGCEPGICLVGDAGHINMYLGEVNGNHYVIHQGGYSYRGEDEITYHFRRVNVNDTELDGGSNIRGWTEITTIKP